MSRLPETLPDLDDDAVFRARMQPLVERTIPESRISGIPVERAATTGAMREVERIERVRGPKKRFEYLIPERVGQALAVDAAKRGVSASTRLLEVLRDSGYPVIREDLVDLRKLPKR
jgi:hypothetical protein